MSVMPSPAEVDQRLRTASALLDFCLRLPHVETPGEQRLLAEFARFMLREAPSCSPLALRAGMRHAWRRGERATIRQAAARIGREVILGDRELATYALVAGERWQTSGPAGT